MTLHAKHLHLAVLHALAGIKPGDGVIRFDPSRGLTVTERRHPLDPWLEPSRITKRLEAQGKT